PQILRPLCARRHGDPATPQRSGGQNVATRGPLHATRRGAQGAGGYAMGRLYDTIDEHLARWIARQSLFFVGSAPLSRSIDELPAIDPP
ncbi:MAG: hypothetical protein ACRDLN_13665, partial [Solirubrobacteraceae bacterium]